MEEHDGNGKQGRTMKVALKTVGSAALLLSLLLAGGLVSELLRSSGRRDPAANETTRAEGALGTVDSAASEGRGTSTPDDVSELASGELDLSVDLPKPYSDQEIRKTVSTALTARIWKTQDEAMSAWPRYSEVREQLTEELSQNMDLQNASGKNLVRRALEFRRKFWQAGGGFSRDSYRDAYMARILLELAHTRNPENLNITDELVQTIQSAHPLATIDKATNKRARNISLEKELLRIRSEQFALIKKEIGQGRAPTINDFIRAFDLAVLQSRHDKESAKDVVEWLQREASQGGWSGYSAALEEFHKSVSAGESFTCNIYVPTRPNFPEDFRYGRRLPSFRWAVGKERGQILWGQDGAVLSGTVYFKRRDNPRRN
jgi:hypothetical protein